MSEDAKKTELSADALDNVAGGTTTENAEILDAQSQLAPERVEVPTNHADIPNHDDIPGAINKHLNDAVQKYLESKIRIPKYF